MAGRVTTGVIALIRGRPPRVRQARGRRRSPAPAPGPPARPRASAWPSSKSVRYATTFSAPAPRAAFRSSWSSCCPTHRTRSPAAGRRPVGGDPVVGPGRQVDDGTGRARRQARRRRHSAEPHPDRDGAERPELADEAGRPDEVVGEDDHRLARAWRSVERGIGAGSGQGVAGAPAVPAPVSLTRPSRSRRSRAAWRCRPRPGGRSASRTWASTSSSCVGRGTLRMTPIGTGNSGQ